jgi:hypothetical protein
MRLIEVSGPRCEFCPTQGGRGCGHSRDTAEPRKPAERRRRPTDLTDETSVQMARRQADASSDIADGSPARQLTCREEHGRVGTDRLSTFEDSEEIRHHCPTVCQRERKVADRRVQVRRYLTQREDSIAQFRRPNAQDRRVRGRQPNTDDVQTTRLLKGNRAAQAPDDGAIRKTCPTLISEDCDGSLDASHDVYAHIRKQVVDPAAPLAIELPNAVDEARKVSRR